MLAATLVVDTANDIVDGDVSSIAALIENLGSDGRVSLREAILATNAEAGGDTIQFHESLDGVPIVLDRLGIGEDFAETGDLDITDDLTILGNGPFLTILDGGGVDRVLDILSGTLNLSGVTIQGGNVSSSNNSLANRTNSGGGIFNSSRLNISNSTISGNSAGKNGGGIYNQGTISSITQSVISQNTADCGAGLASSGLIIDISQSTISHNSARCGGGLYNNGVISSISQITISENIATEFGGGIYNRGNISRISQSTISNNSATHGGGIRNTRTIVGISQSTISGNSADIGGGIENTKDLVVFSNVNLGISQSTISGNVAQTRGGGIYNHAAATISHLQSTIVAGNSSGDAGADLFTEGTLVSATHNLIQSLSGRAVVDGVNNNLVGVDPQLGPLADNGGATLTHAIRSDSPAINVGINPQELFYDQRGEPFYRVFDRSADIGAYEFQPNDLPTPNSFPFQNAANQFDVNANGVVNSIDLLRLIRDLNENNNRALSPTLDPPDLYVDVNGDNLVSPLDMVLLITELNRIAANKNVSPAEGEREFAIQEPYDSWYLPSLTIFAGRLPERGLAGNFSIASKPTIHGHQDSRILPETTAKSAGQARVERFFIPEKNSKRTQEPLTFNEAISLQQDEITLQTFLLEDDFRILEISVEEIF